MPGKVACHPALSWDKRNVSSRPAQFLCLHLCVSSSLVLQIHHESLISPVSRLLYIECDPCPLTQAHVFVHLVPRWWCCLGEVQNLWGARHGWWRWVIARWSFLAQLCFHLGFWSRSLLPHLLRYEHWHNKTSPPRLELPQSCLPAFLDMTVWAVIIPSLGR